MFLCGYSILGSPFWEHVKEMLNPANSIGAEPWVYYTIFAFFVFIFNIFDIVSTSNPSYLVFKCLLSYYAQVNLICCSSSCQSFTIKTNFAENKLLVLARISFLLIKILWNLMLGWSYDVCHVYFLCHI